MSTATLNGDARALIELLFPVDSGKIECRAIRKRTAKGKTEAESITRGQDNLDDLLEFAARHNEQECGVYIGANPIRADYEDAPGRAVCDADVTWRSAMLVDVDSTRADTDAPATEAEADAAIAGGMKVSRSLTEGFGWADPVRIASGNGCQLDYAIDLPNDPESYDLVRAVLRAIAEIHAHLLVGCKIDVGVGNASRVVRLPGSTNFKPNASEERPNRLAELLSRPESLVPLTADQLRDVVAAAAEIRAEREAERPSKPEPRSPFLMIATREGTGRREESFIRAATRKEADKIRVAPQGDRHNQARRSARAIGGFRHYKAVPDPELTDTLVGAAMDAGLGEAEARDVVRWGLDYGASPGQERYLPEPETAQARKSAGGDPEDVQGPQPEPPRRIKPSQLYDDHPKLREPIIDGILRKTEIMNVVAPSKIGKSWLVLGLLFCVAIGRLWLGRFPVKRGRVLLVDNELHQETIASRMRWVAQAMGLMTSDYDDWIEVECLRGRLQGLETMGRYFEGIKGEFDFIILDSGYRFTTPNDDENSNASVTQRYNLLDHYATISGSAIGYVHHSSKGSQADKAVTDVGAGAGAQSRAVDTHLVLLSEPTLGPGRLMVDAAIRSFPPIDPFSIRKEGPLWIADGATPDAEERRQAAQAVKEEQRRHDAEEREEKALLANVGKVVEAIRWLDAQGKPATANAIRDHAVLSGTRAGAALARAERDGRILSRVVENLPRGPKTATIYSLATERRVSK